jgi:acetyl-CoA acetyltransferase
LEQYELHDPELADTNPVRNEEAFDYVKVEKYLRSKSTTFRAVQSKIISIGWASVDPSIMGEGIVPATKKALARANLEPDDIDLWEINEAFAVLVLNAMQELGGIPRAKVNINGGAIAIGHPLGASGARLAGTLSRMLNQSKLERGIATLCIGGGQGYSAVFKRAS